MWTMPMMPIDIKIEIIKVHLKALENELDDLFNSVKNLINK